MNKRFEQIQRKHTELLEKAEATENKADLLEEVQAFITEVQEAGREIPDVLERDQARSILHYWGAFVHEQVGEYPPSQLASAITPKRLPKVILAVIGLMVVIIVLFKILATTTPAPIATLPPPSSSVIDCPFAPKHLSLASTPVNVEARITTPKHCAERLPKGSGINIAGVYSGNLAGWELWILVRDPEGLFYPQSMDACAGAFMQTDQGRWSARARLDEKEDTGLQLFDIIIATTLVDSPASESFKNWLDIGCRTGDFPGFHFDDLPEELTELDSVTVTTQRFSESEPKSKCPFALLQHPTIAGSQVAVRASITAPQRCADNLTAGTRVYVKGFYSGNLSGLGFWILVYDPDALFYPQAINACTRPFVDIQDDDSVWNTFIRLGNEGDVGLFNIILTVAPVDSPASQIFTKWLDTGCNTGRFRGFDALPEGLTELDAITVKVQQ